MIVQSSNLPLHICLNRPTATLPDLHLALLDTDGRLLKSWGRDDVVLQGDSILAPLTQQETAGFPDGFAVLLVKFLDETGKTVFCRRIRTTILPWEDREKMGGAQYD